MLAAEKVWCPFGHEGGVSTIRIGCWACGTWNWCTCSCVNSDLTEQWKQDIGQLPRRTATSSTVAAVQECTFDDTAVSDLSSERSIHVIGVHRTGLHCPTAASVVPNCDFDETALSDLSSEHSVQLVPNSGNPAPAISATATTVFHHLPNQDVPTDGSDSESSSARPSA